jgi:hypothetical protein
MVSPDQDAVAQINVGGEQYSVTLPKGIVVDFDAGRENVNVSAVIKSASPILVSHRGELAGGRGFSDASPVPPAAHELWGILSRYAEVGAVEDNTQVTVYSSKGKTQSLVLDAGEKRVIEVDRSAPQGLGSAIRLVANKPIGAVQIADGDGIEQVAFFPTALLATRFGIPVNAQYVAGVCAQEQTVVTLYNGDDAPITRRCRSTADYPGKIYFGSAKNGVVGVKKGAYIESDKPIHLIYEVSQSQDEHNLLGTQEP